MKTVKFLALLMSALLLLSAALLPASAYAVADGAEQSYAAAAEAMVLLKNENGALPLTATDKIALFGEGQVYTDGKTGGFYLMGRGSGYFVPSETPPSPYALLTSYAEAGKLGGVYTELCASYEAAKVVGEDFAYSPTDAEYAAAAAYADKAVVFISRTSSEGADRPKSAFSLSAAEKTQLEKVCAAFAGKPVIVVLNLGNVIDCGFALGRVDGIYADALLTATYPGIRGVQALCDILVGTVNPSGKLVDTYAKTLEDYPSYTGFYESKDYTTYYEDIYVGYRYFETFGVEVDYPFGYGLSYTTFDITDVTYSETATDITVTAKVTNTGSVAGKEVVQVYFGAPQKGTNGAVLSKAAKELCGFAKTSLLAAGASETVTVSFPIDTMASYDDLGSTGHKSAYVLEAGEYAVYVGNSVRNTVVAGTHTEETLRVVEQLSELCEPTVAFERLTFDGTETVGETSAFRSDLLHKPTEAKRDRQKEPIQFSAVLSGSVSADKFLAQMSDRELASFALMTNASPTSTGAWGASAAVAEKYGMPLAYTCDGPAGIRHSTKGTGLPAATALACTWNRDIVAVLGDVIGRECADTDIDVWLAPGVNIHRYPLCGRNFEYYSEDPYLTGVLASELIGGVEKNGIAASVKHFIANEKEQNRNQADSRMSERALREIYLVPFQMAVEQGVSTIMTSYNFLNGTETSENAELLRGIVRGEWGFDGLFTTDWSNDSSVDKEMIGGNNVHSSMHYGADGGAYEYHMENQFAALYAAIDNGTVSRSLLLENAGYMMDLLQATAAADRLKDPAVHTVTATGASTFEAEDYTQKHGYARPEVSGSRTVMSYVRATAAHIPYLVYTLDVAQAGSYILTTSMANNSSDANGDAIHVFVNGVEQYSNYNGAPTGGWYTMETREIGRVDLPAGKVILKLKATAGHACGNFDSFTLTPIGEVYTPVANADALIALMGDSTKWAGKYYLTADIDLTGKTGQGPIGTNAANFTGSFDGMGHAIRGLALTTSTEQDFGLFGKVKGAVIRDLKVYGSVSSTRTTSAVVGGIVGTADPGTVVVGCENHADVTYTYAGAAKGIGGVVGYSYSGTAQTATVVKQCVNHGTVTANTSGHSYVGGVVGVIQNNGAGSNILDRSVNHGTVYGAGQRVGGVLGYVTQAATGGGVTASNLVNRGSVTSALGRLGGVIGFIESKSVTEGKTPLVQNCVNFGTVSGGTGYEIAGILGYLAGGGTFRDSVNFGTVTASDDKPVAGVLGKTYTALTALTHAIENCYTTAYEVIPADGYEKPNYFIFTDCGVKTKAEIEAGNTTLSYGENGFVMTSAGLTPSAFVGTLPLGDIDADGGTEIRDVLLLLQAILNRENPMNPWFADVTEDGKYSLLDALAILKICIQ